MTAWNESAVIPPEIAKLKGRMFKRIADDGFPLTAIVTTQHDKIRVIQIVCNCAECDCGAATDSMEGGHEMDCNITYVARWPTFEEIFEVLEYLVPAGAVMQCQFQNIDKMREAGPEIFVALIQIGQVSNGGITDGR